METARYVTSKVGDRRCLLIRLTRDIAGEGKVSRDRVLGTAGRHPTHGLADRTQTGQPTEPEQAREWVKISNLCSDPCEWVQAGHGVGANPRLPLTHILPSRLRDPGDCEPRDSPGQE